MTSLMWQIAGGILLAKLILDFIPTLLAAFKEIHEQHPRALRYLVIGVLVAFAIVTKGGRFK